MLISYTLALLFFSAAATTGAGVASGAGVPVFLLLCLQANAKGMQRRNNIFFIIDD
jgi:hypothetical protein